MKIFVLFLAVAVSSSEAIKCFEGRGDGVKLAECPSAESTKCSGPKFYEYTGVSSNAPYSCGPCPAAQEGKVCETCTGDSCNKPHETGEDFKCKYWEYREAKWSVTERATVCKRLKSTMIMCNMPTAATGKYYKIENSGCGPCLAAEKAKGTCQDCNSPECNRAFDEEKEDEKKEDEKKEDEKEDSDKDNDYKPSDGTLAKISVLVFGFFLTLLM